MTLPLDSGPKLAVGQWIAWWSGLPGESSSRRKLCILSYHSCHIYRTWKSIYVGGWGGGGGFWSLQMGQVTKGWDHFYGGSWPLKTPCKDFNLAIVGGLDWMKLLKMRQVTVYISCNYSCTIFFWVKILLVKLKWLFIQYAWISIMKKQNSNQNVKVGKMVVLVKFRLKFNHGFTNHGYLHSAVWKALHNVKIKRAHEGRHNQFFF